MFKTIAAATLAANASAFSSAQWYLPSIDFTAIEKSYNSRYWLAGKYGPNNMGWWGQNAYIYLEVGGDEIADGAVVTSWATIIRPTEYRTIRDPFTGAVTTEEIPTGVPYTQTETVECAVIYHQEPPAGVEKQFTPSGTTTVNSSGGPAEVSFYNAPHTDISVRTYRGKIENGTFYISNMNNVWYMPVNTAYRYPQGHIQNQWDEAAFSGCYMQRRSVFYSSDFDLKNAVEYEVAVGYNIYNSDYNIN